jgi:Tim44-like domain
MKRLAPAIALAVLVLAATLASARPGGGQSYSGSGSSSSGRSSGSSSSSSDSGSSSSGSSYSSTGSSSHSSGGSTLSTGNGVGDFFGYVVLIVAGLIMLASMKERVSDQSAGYGLGSTLAPPTPVPVDRDDLLAALRERDPDFSLVLFEDFLFTLYAEAHRARHDAAALASLGGYLSDAAREKLAAQPGRVLAVAVGALSFRTPDVNAERAEVLVAFESNLHTELSAGPVTQYVEERWTLRRAAAARTVPVRGVRKFGCPSCGAPYRPADDGRCQSCGGIVSDGRFDWVVVRCSTETMEVRPNSFTGHAEEVGTSDLTVFQPFCSTRRQELTAADPAVTTESLDARLRLIAATLSQAWADQDLRAAQPFLSERLVAYMQYWIDEYKAQGLRNAVADPVVERVVVARVERDAHYDAVVLRFWASGGDYTEEVATRRVVGGSATVRRHYSEYWTLIRSAGVRGAPRADKACPACGAPLDVNMAGECAHCAAHITSGEFDWVVSKIEQDEAYRG